MRIIAKRNVDTFAETHADAASSLLHWYTVSKAASWQSMNDVMADFPKAKALNAERVRFEVAGGNYRLIAAVHFRLSIVWIKFLGTHAEYDRVEALTVSQF